jgi:hypothetical protein
MEKMQDLSIKILGYLLGTALIASGCSYTKHSSEYRGTVGNIAFQTGHPAIKGYLGPYIGLNTEQGYAVILVDRDNNCDLGKLITIAWNARNRNKKIRVNAKSAGGIYLEIDELPIIVDEFSKLPSY